jgi:dimethylaniline monooxygenase (N-oxide forming)
MGTLVSYTPYMDSLAELIGCRPRLQDFVAEPRLAYHLICGANIPTVYRLCGPHADPEMAKRVVLSLPIAHTPQELARLGYLHVLHRLGRFSEPPHASAN